MREADPNGQSQSPTEGNATPLNGGGMGSPLGMGGDPRTGVAPLLRSLTYHTAFTASELRTGSLTSQEESYIIYIAEYAPLYYREFSPRPVSGMRKRQHGSQKGNKQRIEKIFLFKEVPRGKLPPRTLRAT